MSKEHEQAWKTPPPGMTIVKDGIVKEGDYFYIEQLGAWGPVPKIGWGEPINTALVARGSIVWDEIKGV